MKKDPLQSRRAKAARGQKIPFAGNLIDKSNCLRPPKVAKEKDKIHSENCLSEAIDILLNATPRILPHGNFIHASFSL